MVPTFTARMRMALKRPCIELLNAVIRQSSPCSWASMQPMNSERSVQRRQSPNCRNTSVRNSVTVIAGGDSESAEAVGNLVVVVGGQNGEPELVRPFAERLFVFHGEVVAARRN